jgi:hypothetical protein
MNPAEGFAPITGAIAFMDVGCCVSAASGSGVLLL